MATKKQVYGQHNVQYKGGKILSPIGWIPELLKVGNIKTGKEVYTWSLLPGTGEYKAEINNTLIPVPGTCVFDCIGCYAEAGFYRMANVVNSLAVNTYLVNEYPDFVKSAISAQLETLGQGEIRIHAAGDFNTKDPDNYSKIWKDIATKYSSFLFWTYTKVKQYETLFDNLNNANIVKSVIPGIGINFGKCEYVINAYFTLRSLGIPVYICKCGIDKNQHCQGCGICATYKYVLFVEHSTNYKAEEDPLYPKLCEIINNQ